MINYINYSILGMSAKILKPRFFNYSLVRIASVLYVSLFTQPRKFLLHYFWGKGTSITCNTQEIFQKNPKVCKRVIEDISKNGSSSGKVSIPQTLLSNHSHLLSIGSFTVHYIKDSDKINFQVISRYSFSASSERLTYELHEWLRRFKKNCSAHNFCVNGDLWHTSMFELNRNFNNNWNFRKNAFEIPPI